MGLGDGTSFAEQKTAATGRCLIDGHGHRVSYLRLSVTDRCNLRYHEGLPEDNTPVAPREDLLSSGDLGFLARVAVDRGVRKIRITGGEPLLRSDLRGLLADFRALPELEHLALTTNGSRLEMLAASLRSAGLDSVNIHIDSLRRDRFARITRYGTLEACLDGIAAACQAGLQVKLNVVLMRGINDDEILDFIAYSAGMEISVRFIEHMPIGNPAIRGGPFNLTVPSDEVLNVIGREFAIEPADRVPHAGPSRDFHLSGPDVTIGVISALSHPFCGECNRIRVTATGGLRSCLLHAGEVQLSPLLAARDEAGLTRALQKAVKNRPAAHGIQYEQVIPGLVDMSRTGG